MMTNKSRNRAIVLSLAFAGAATLYVSKIRPWAMHWGASAEEVARPMPGDEIVEHPWFDATRAVTVQARPEQIWPWLAQIGFRKAGWYSYDIVDNLGKPSARAPARVPARAGG